MSDTAAQDYWHHTRTTVNDYLHDFLETKHRQALARSEAEGRLWQLLTDVIEAGGKRLRPSLVIWAYQAFGGGVPDKVLPVAAAWEFLHQGLLIHDDIIDRDYVRHGQPNVAGQLRSYYPAVLTETDRDHYANSGALLAGDLALSTAHRLLSTSEFPATKILLAHDVLGSSLEAVITGELLDTEAVMQPPDATDPLLVAELKTATYSFMGPLQTGALLADAPKIVQKQLAQLGTAVGIAFQLSDDLLGVYGDEATTGKTTDGDIREGKRTLLLQYALQGLKSKDRQTIEKIIGNAAATPTDITTFRRLVTASGARIKVEKLIDQYLAQADRIVESLPCSNLQSKDQYQYLAQKLRRRMA